MERLMIIATAEYAKAIPESLIDGLSEEVRKHFTAYGFSTVEVTAVREPQGTHQTGEPESDMERDRR